MWMYYDPAFPGEWVCEVRALRLAALCSLKKDRLVRRPGRLLFRKVSELCLCRTAPARYLCCTDFDEKTFHLTPQGLGAFRQLPRGVENRVGHLIGLSGDMRD